MPALIGSARTVQCGVPGVHSINCTYTVWMALRMGHIAPAQAQSQVVALGVDHHTRRRCHAGCAQEDQPHARMGEPEAPRRCGRALRAALPPPLRGSAAPSGNLRERRLGNSALVVNSGKASRLLQPGHKITPPQNHNPKSRFHPRSSRLKAFDRTVFQPSPLASSDGGEGKGVGMIWPRWAGADGCAG